MANGDTSWLQNLQFAPQAPQGLQGAIGGIADVQGLANWRQNMGLANTLNQMILQGNQGRLSEWQANAPLREQARALELQYAGPERAQKFGKGEEELTQLRARTPGVEAETRGKVGKEDLESMERDTQALGLMLPSFQGPTATADFSRWAESKGWRKDNPSRQFLERATSTEDFKARGQYLLDQASRSLAQRRAESQQLIETGSRERIADVAGQYSLERQRLANEGARAVQEAKTDKEKRIDKLEGQLVDSYRRWQAETNPKRKAELKNEVTQLFQMLQLFRSAGAPYIPNVNIGGAPLMQPRAPQPLPGQTQPSQEQQLPPGWRRVQ